MIQIKIDKLMTSGEDPNKHVVANSERAVNKFVGGRFLSAFGVFINVLSCSLLALACFAIAGKSNGCRIVGFILLGLGGLSFIANHSHMGNAFRMVVDSFFTPKRQSAEATLKTFISCMFDCSFKTRVKKAILPVRVDWRIYVSSRMIERAYNCLTDTAQSLLYPNMPRDSYVRRKMVKPKITTARELEEWWEQSSVALGYRFMPDVDRIKMLEQSDDLAVLSLPIKLTWNQDQKTMQGETNWIIPLVKRDEYWFMTAGYFWPQPDEEIEIQEALDKRSRKGGV